jgi:histidyl-tRNA synthetase
MAQPPSIPSGMRDFAPEEIARRNYILGIIKNEFHLYGFQPIETPAMENLSTLLGKYGDEGDKLLFKVLNSGNAFAKFSPADIENPNAAAMKACEKGLRYDLTVPFARYVAQHQNDIAFPFRRYQIQPVWRADRPQKGRYREFCQCDADIVGADSLLCEAELILMTSSIFSKLGIEVTMKINNRKILYGFAECLGVSGKFMQFAAILDKVEKIPQQQFETEMQALGITTDSIAMMAQVLNADKKNQLTNHEKLHNMRSFLAASQTGLAGVQEMDIIFEYLEHQKTHCQVEFDLVLARGLNYYTGAIFEVKANDAAIGSICGGGRYDNLTGVFGLKGISGVGISFGADRIYDVMLDRGLFPADTGQSTQVVFLNMGKQEELRSLSIAQSLRERGIAAEVYPSPRKLQKQMDYLNRRRIPYAAIIGADELAHSTISIKNMRSGEQKKIKANSKKWQKFLYDLMSQETKKKYLSELKEQRNQKIMMMKEKHKNNPELTEQIKNELMTIKEQGKAKEKHNYTDKFKSLILMYYFISGDTQTAYKLSNGSIHRWLKKLCECEENFLTLDITIEKLKKSYF